MSWLLELWVGIFLIFYIVESGWALDCYRCNSSHTLDCLEKFIQPNSLVPEPCSDVFEARYCIKVTGIYEGVEGAHRFCSSKDMGNYCEYITREDDKREFRSCVYTCETDGCNTAARTKISDSVVSIGTFVLFVIALVCCSHRQWNL